jgi:hypothetical protein
MLFLVSAPFMQVYSALLLLGRRVLAPALHHRTSCSACTTMLHAHDAAACVSR